MRLKSAVAGATISETDFHRVGGADGRNRFKAPDNGAMQGLVSRGEGGVNTIVTSRRKKEATARELPVSSTCC
jgi:hypothetical protein